MARALALALGLGFAVVSCAPDLPPEQQLEETARGISSQIRCPVCQGLSIQDSPTPLAQDMRAVVREQLAQGKTPAEVKSFFVARYGEYILMTPQAEGFNLAVYILPGLALLGGAIFVLVLVRRWSSRPADPAPKRSGAGEVEPELAPWKSDRKG